MVKKCSLANAEIVHHIIDLHVCMSMTILSRTWDTWLVFTFGARELFLVHHVMTSYIKTRAPCFLEKWRGPKIAF